MDHSRFVEPLAPPEDAPDGELLIDLSSDDMKMLMQSRSGSHLLEVIVRVAPKTLGAEIWRRFFRDKLMSISKHQVANFVLQSVLGSSKDPAVIASAVSELSALFGTLLYENRAGVIAALLAACLRLKTNEKDCCKALARGVTFKLEKKNATAENGSEGGSRKGGKSQLARALLFLGNPAHGRCSVLGAAMMQTLAKYPADATIMFLESLSRHRSEIPPPSRPRCVWFPRHRSHLKFSIGENQAQTSNLRSPRRQRRRFSRLLWRLSSPRSVLPRNE